MYLTQELIISPPLFLFCHFLVFTVLFFSFQDFGFILLFALYSYFFYMATQFYNRIYYCTWLLKRKTWSCWNLLTFQAITSVMNHGIVKQLDFEDLLELPTDMDPSSCHATLLNCWHAQQRHNCSHPSLFRAICYAYGWPYFRLGLLKVFYVVICLSFVLLYKNRKKFQLMLLSCTYITNFIFLHGCILYFLNFMKGIKSSYL